MKNCLWSALYLLLTGPLFAQYSNDFDSWPILAEGSWSYDQPEGTYVSQGCYVNFGNTNSGLRKVGFNGVGDLFQLPPLDNPQAIGFAARISSGSGAAIAVEYFDGSTWQIAGICQINSTSYQGYGAQIPQEGIQVPLRLRMTQHGNSVYIDDLGVSAKTLPVELASFRAETGLSGEVVLRWRTLTETNNDYFALERGDDAAVFDSLARIEGAGTTIAPRSYTYTDRDPLPGLSYYRLKQIDYDGSTHFSQVYEIRRKGPVLSFLLYPNPVKSSINLKLQALRERPITWNILALDGRTETEGKIPPHHRYATIDLPDLGPGQYILRIIDGRKVSQRRFIKH
ncbi:MAG: T9SS type A sorting domain-containing protein [Saprospiraceae bacterium]|nr:T9SS type A sorting domain-containing protein [Saprospiraceae bacterium]